MEYQMVTYSMKTVTCRPSGDHERSSQWPQFAYCPIYRKQMEIGDAI